MDGRAVWGTEERKEGEMNVRAGWRKGRFRDGRAAWAMDGRTALRIEGRKGG
jgi:hypothetical protein